MSLLAPYNRSMRLGSGFNSYTQQLCVDRAVVREDDENEEPPKVDKPKSKNGVPQAVTYKTTMIDKVSDVTNALNINGAVTIKYGDMIDGSGKGEFVNSDKIKESSASFLITVKVVNQTFIDHKLTKFNPIKTLPPSEFPEVFGDCFISGIQEGGEFNALVSIKSTDKKAANHLAVSASINLTNAIKGKDLEGSAEGKVDKSVDDILRENETTISVNWTGGGQELKGSGEDWNFRTLRAAAIKFPELVAKTPMRTHAILTKYTSLRSFYSLGMQYSPMTYENAGGYTAILQEAYLDYKNLYKSVQLTAASVDAKKKTLAAAKVPQGSLESDQGLSAPVTHGSPTSQEAVPNTRISPEEAASRKEVEANAGVQNQPDPANASNGDSDQGSKEELKPQQGPGNAGQSQSQGSGTGSEVQGQEEANKGEESAESGNPSKSGEPTNTSSSALNEAPASKKKKNSSPPTAEPLVIHKPYTGNLIGLEKAKLDIRFMMNRIVAEVDVITRWPEAANDEARVAPFMSPLLFKQYLPIAHDVKSEEDEE